MSKIAKKRVGTGTIHRSDRSTGLMPHQRVFCERLVHLLEQCTSYKLVNTDFMIVSRALYSTIVTELNYMVPKAHQKQLQSEEVLLKLADLAYSDLVLKYIQYSGIYELGDYVSLDHKAISDFVMTYYRKVAMEYLQDRYAGLLPVRRYTPKKVKLTDLQAEVFNKE